MSIATCTDCCDQVDTDYKPMYEIGEGYVCEQCLEKYPEDLARADYEMGGGHDDNPYEYDADPFSKHQLYKWSMAQCQNENWNKWFRSL